MSGLRAFLDAGGDPTTLDRWKSLVDDARMVVTTSTSALREEAENLRQTVATVLGRDDPVAEHFARVAEMYDDPTLARRLIDSLPPEPRQKVLHELDQSRRPFPISVVVPVMDERVPGTAEGTWFLRWECCNCGEAHDVGDGTPVVVIGYRPGWSTLDDDQALTYCAGCITIAGQVASSV